MTPLQLIQQKAGTTPDNDFGPKSFAAINDLLGITDLQGAHFWAQVAHETAMFRRFEENLNYSAKGLLSVFGKYFYSENQAEAYERQPEQIANRVYANRMGNGDEDSGDGWKYRGRGALQLTGKNNYAAFTQATGIDHIGYPDAVANEFAFDSAVWFFKSNNLFAICQDLTNPTITRLTKRINGGTNGIQHRTELTHTYAAFIRN